MPSTSTPVPKADCSVSANTLSGFLFSTMRPTGSSGNWSSGQRLVSSSGSKSSSGCSPSAHDLHAEFPLRKLAALDRLVQVARGVAGVLALDLGGLLAGQVAHALLRLPVEFHQVGDALVVHQFIGVDARAFHLAVVGRDAPWALDPGDHVQRFRMAADEIVEAPRLLLVGDRVGLEGVDHVRELDRIADEEDLQVVADQVPVAVDGLQLDGEAARVARRFRRFLAADHGREAHEHRASARRPR